MEWEKAKEEIKKKVKVDTDVNTNESNHRVVKCVCDWGLYNSEGKELQYESDLGHVGEMLESDGLQWRCLRSQ